MKPNYTGKNQFRKHLKTIDSFCVSYFYRLLIENEAMLVYDKEATNLKVSIDILKAEVKSQDAVSPYDIYLVIVIEWTHHLK